MPCLSLLPLPVGSSTTRKTLCTRGMLSSPCFNSGIPTQWARASKKVQMLVSVCAGLFPPLQHPPAPSLSLSFSLSLFSLFSLSLSRSLPPLTQIMLRCSAQLHTNCYKVRIWVRRAAKYGSEHGNCGRLKSPLATDNLLENIDGVGAPHQCSLGAAPCHCLSMLTAAFLMTSLHSEGPAAVIGGPSDNSVAPFIPRI